MKSLSIIAVLCVWIGAYLVHLDKAEAESQVDIWDCRAGGALECYGAEMYMGQRK